METIVRKPIWQCAFIVFVLLLLANRSIAESYRHPETALVFPDRLATMEKIDVTDYERKQSGLGVSVGYGASNMVADIYLYTLGMKSVPSDIEAPVFRKHFDQVIGDVFRAGENGPYRNVKKSSEVEGFLNNSHTGPKALSASFNYVIVRNGKEVLSKLYLIGYKNHFLKIRFTYHRDMQLEGEQTLKQFLAQLSELIK